MYKQNFFICVAAILSCIIFTSCGTPVLKQSSEQNRQMKLVEQNNISKLSNYNSFNKNNENTGEETAAVILEQISRINRYYDMEQIADVFGKWPLSIDTNLTNVVSYWYEFNDVEFNVGFYSRRLRSNIHSASLATGEEKNGEAILIGSIPLGLYTFDEEATQADVAAAKKLDHKDFKSDIQQAKSNGIIDSIERLDELIILLSEVKQKSTVEELVDIFGKVPKDISDGVRDKFVYYAGDITIVLYDSPFTYMELYVPGGSVKVMFSKVGD